VAAVVARLITSVLLPEAAHHSEVKGGLTAARNVRNWARTEGLTIRQLYERFAGARGQRTLKGTPSEIVDDMQAWFDNRAIDGFLIQPSHLPVGLN
jgi:N-acetyl-S-(2-succino)cysteine monooxygenase